MIFSPHAPQLCPSKSQPELSLWSLWAITQSYPTFPKCCFSIFKKLVESKDLLFISASEFFLRWNSWNTWTPWEQLFLQGPKHVVGAHFSIPPSTYLQLCTKAPESSFWAVQNMLGHRDTQIFNRLCTALSHRVWPLATMCCQSKQRDVWGMTPSCPTGSYSPGAGTEQEFRAHGKQGDQTPFASTSW